MMTKTQITHDNLTRQELLLIWLRRANLTQRQVAEALDVTPIAVTRWFFHKNYIPTWRHQQLMAFGIPEDLLPPAKDVAPGPKRGERHIFAAAE